MMMGNQGDGRSPASQGQATGLRPQPPAASSQSGVLNAGALRVWWIPQVPMAAFEVDVPDLATASAILDVLADYDAFQFENNVKGDYCNTGGLTVLREDGEWEDWWTGDGEGFDEWRRENLPRLRTNGWGEPLPASGIEGESPAPQGETPTLPGSGAA